MGDAVRECAAGDGCDTCPHIFKVERRPDLENRKIELRVNILRACFVVVLDPCLDNASRRQQNLPLVMTL